MDELYELRTPDELAAHWKVPKSWIYGQTRLTGPDAIPRLRVGKYLRFEMGAVEAWLREQSEKKVLAKGDEL